MGALKSLLAATDFSDDSRNAARRAARLAAEQGAQLTLLPVMSGPSLETLRDMFRVPEDAEAMLVADARNMLNELSADIAGAGRPAPATQVRVGRVVDEVLSAAQQADLLVLGARGWNPVRDTILGTTAARLLRKCPRPVLVVKGAPQEAYRRVLVPVDFSPCSAAAFQMARRIAPDADITIIHACKVPFEKRLRLAGVSTERLDEYRAQARQRAMDNVDLLLREAVGSAQRFSRVVEHDAAAPLILGKAAEFAADLIVMGKHGQSRVDELLLGSVTRHVLSDAKCDVLVVREMT
jgi:nucleotide-binding universal stress UspA family protein